MSNIKPEYSIFYDKDKGKLRINTNEFYKKNDEIVIHPYRE